MIEQRGRVTRIDGDAAQVRLGGQSGCPACDAGEGCGAGIFGRLLRRSGAEVTVANRRGARPGQSVMLGIPESTYLSLVMGLYGWPLLAALAGAVLAFQAGLPVFGDQGWRIDVAAALGGILAGGLVLYRSRRRLPQRFTRLSLEMLESPVQLDCVSADRNQ